MKAIELLSVDFSKYEKVMINHVIITGAEIVAQEDHLEDISLLGFIKEELIFTTHYNKDDEVKIKELDEHCLTITKK